MTALSFGGAPGVAVLGGDLSQLRRRGGRWRLRDWRLRTKLTAVLMVPLLLAGVLGALRVADSLREARQLDTLAQQVSFAQQVGATAHDLQRERALSVTKILAPGTIDPALLSAQAARVDRDGSALRAADPGARDLSPAAAQAYQVALERLADLPAIRADQTAAVPGATGPAVAADKAIAGYTDVIAELLNLNRVVLNGASEPLGRDVDGLSALSVATEQVSRQHAVLLAAMLSGALSAEQQAALRTADARSDAAVSEFREGVPAEQEQRYDTTVTGQSVTDKDRLLDTALARALQNAPLEIVPANWDLAAGDTVERIYQVRTALLDRLLNDVGDASAKAWNDSLRDAVVVALLLALAVSLLVVVVRSLLEPLRTLRTHAFDVADRRLPEAVEKLRDTEDKIGEATVDPVPVYSREEVGQVARAFDTVHVQAVRLAAEQAMLRGTLNDIFLNLAGRSQRLVERQLKLIDKLERGEQDPEQLSNLFQLDHLATRMRRNSENLLVLAGGELRRGTERGAPVLDMLRAAISEIAEYRRVSLRRPPSATVAGPVVTDLVHLIAELLDNATNAAPPETTVTLSSALTEDGGLLVTIIDRGTGLPPSELHAINERLASPPVVDVSVSRQMGLFVVSRLAARHRIRVRLRQQRGEFGITATVLLPSTLVCADGQAPVDEIDETASGASGTRGRQGRSGTAWSQNVDLPLQVSVVEGAAEGDLFSPSSIGNLTAAQRSPRTAEQEWRDLFGGDQAAEQVAEEPRGADRPADADRGDGEHGVAEQGAGQGGAGEGGAGERGAGERGGPEPRPGPEHRRPASAPVPSGADVLGSAAPSGDPGAAREPAPEVHEEIFEAVSAWFREGRSEPAAQPQPPDRPQLPTRSQPPARPHSAADMQDMATPPTGFSAPPATPSPALPALNWRSAGDEGWQAANALRAPAEFDVTPAGLPRRRPREQLVPGAARPVRSPAAGPSVPPRTPDDVRGRLSSYQRGLRHGRHTLIGPEEPPARSYPQGNVEEG